MYAQAYGPDGNLVGTPRKFEDINRRNNEAPNRIVIDANTAVDNVRVYEVAEGKVVVASENDAASMSASSSLQMSATVYTAKDELMPGHVSYSLYQNNDQLFSDHKNQRGRFADGQWRGAGTGCYGSRCVKKHTDYL